MCDKCCIEAGNPEKKYVKLLYDKPNINTFGLYEDLVTPKRFDCPDLFKGYGFQKEKQHPLYKTESSEYGYYAPNTATIPMQYFPRSQRFSNALAKCGMYRNWSLNTIMDKSYY